MSPEFLREKRFEITSDSYAFGIAIWEILTEKEPHSQFMPVQVLF
jgi:hypothetical protein